MYALRNDKDDAKDFIFFFLFRKTFRHHSTTRPKQHPFACHLLTLSLPFRLCGTFINIYLCQLRIKSYYLSLQFHLSPEAKVNISLLGVLRFTFFSVENFRRISTDMCTNADVVGYWWCIAYSLCGIQNWSGKLEEEIIRTHTHTMFSSWMCA